MDVIFLTRKATATGFRFQINGRGPWLSEYQTDSRVPNGTYAVIEAGVRVGEWVQSTFYHEVR